MWNLRKSILRLHSCGQSPSPVYLKHPKKMWIRKGFQKLSSHWGVRGLSQRLFQECDGSLSLWPASRHGSSMLISTGTGGTGMPRVPHTSCHLHNLHNAWLFIICFQHIRREFLNERLLKVVLELGNVFPLITLHCLVLQSDRVCLKLHAGVAYAPVSKTEDVTIRVPTGVQDRLYAIPENGTEGGIWYVALSSWFRGPEAHGPRPVRHDDSLSRPSRWSADTFHQRWRANQSMARFDFAAGRRPLGYFVDSDFIFDFLTWATAKTNSHVLMPLGAGQIISQESGVWAGWNLVFPAVCRLSMLQ